MTHFEFHPEYVAHLSVDTPEAIIGHIHHVQRSGQLTREVPVAYFHATMAAGDEWSVEHHDVRLFIRSSVRHDPGTYSTTVVASPEQQAGSNRELLQQLRALADGPIAPCHPDMVGAFGQSLLTHSCCTEPMFLSVYYAGEVSGVEFGDISAD